MKIPHFTLLFTISILSNMLEAQDIISGNLRGVNIKVTSADPIAAERDWIVGQSIALGEGEIAQFLDGFSTYEWAPPFIVFIDLDGDEVNVVKSDMIAGPGSLTVYVPASYPGAQSEGWAIASIGILAPPAVVDETFSPSNSVVIPEDSVGQVEIIMESSTDMVNWNVAQPGVYLGNTKKRFFRLRAVRM